MGLPVLSSKNRTFSMRLKNTTTAQDAVLTDAESAGGCEEVLDVVKELDQDITKLNKQIEELKYEIERMKNGYEP
jgi:peptidoglycan hydrolase CwlO-like protein